MESGGLDLSLLLKSGDDASLGPASDGSEVSERAEVSVGLESEGSESVRDDHSLLLVIGVGDTLEDLQLVESGGALGELVGEHASEALPENARGGLPMLGATARVGVNALLHNVLSNDLVSLEGTRLKDLLTADDGDALSTEKLLGDHTSEAALQVTSSVND